MRRAGAVLVFVALLAGHAVGAPQKTLTGDFGRRMGEAIGRRDVKALHRLLPYLAADEIRSWFSKDDKPLHAVVRQLGPQGRVELAFVHIEERGPQGPVTLYQCFGEVRQAGRRTIVARAVPVSEAARAFRIAAHRSGVRIEADSGDTEIVDKMEIEVVQPTRVIFFLLDPGRQISAVSIDAGDDTQVYRLANFVSLERSLPWPVGARVWVEVRSRTRVVRLPKV